MSWRREKPHLKPYIGCLNCGGGEMKMNSNKTEITASLHTRIYQGFGGWTIRCDDKIVYQGPPDKEWHEYPTLMKFENMARKNWNHDWRAECYLPLREAVYQRQGHNRWVLISSGPGFA